VDELTPTRTPPERKELEEGLRFMHLLTMQLKQDVYDTRARLRALLGELGATETVDLEATEARLEDSRETEYSHIRDHAYVQIAEPNDKYALPELPDLDCASRVHLCEAKCCTFSFRLSSQDLDEGVLRWEYGQPYAIKQKPSGYCTHSCEDQGGGCGVYTERPAPCRTYDCRDDERIWSDFDAMIPAKLDP
jgi:hypothetical protein